jgi:glycosyltransferase involved in cell wall biosynthesis
MFVNIGFDAKRLFNNFTGLGNYSRFVVHALAENFPDNRYSLYTPKYRNHPELMSIVDRSNVDVYSPSFFYRFLNLTSAWRTWRMGSLASVKKLDVYHGLSQELPVALPKNTKKIVTVHDLIFLHYPWFYNPIDVAIYSVKVRIACKEADKIIAVSQQTAQDIEKLLGVNPSKIVVIPQGCDASFKRNASKQEIETIKQKYNLPAEYMLSVGTIEKRKNALLLVKALALIPESIRIPLVIVGKATTYLKEIIACAKEKEVLSWIHFLHDASFQDFPEIYQGSRMFLFPSIYEGFGIPILEAIESGVPVITSNRAVFRETAGPDALYIDPEEPAEAAIAAVILLYDDELRHSMITNSRNYISRFQPKVIADSLQHIYES